jgi:hypothetical protein
LLYDLQTIGVDLRDYWRPGTGVTPRYVLWLVGQLGADSAFSASMRGGSEHRGWTSMTYLQAATVNLLHAQNRMHAGKKTKEPLVKPPAHKRRERRMSVTDVRARLGVLNTELN